MSACRLSDAGAAPHSTGREKSDVTELQAALATAQAQNVHLRGTLAAMRKEMEEVSGALCRAGGGASTAQHEQHSGTPALPDGGRANSSRSGDRGGDEIRSSGAPAMAACGAGGTEVSRGEAGAVAELTTTDDDTAGAQHDVGEPVPPAIDAATQADLQPQQCSAVRVNEGGGMGNPGSTGDSEGGREDAGCEGGTGAGAEAEECGVGVGRTRAELARETQAREAAEARVERLQMENERLMDISGELRAQWAALTAQLPPAFVEAALCGGCGSDSGGGAVGWSGVGGDGPGSPGGAEALCAGLPQHGVPWAYSLHSMRGPWDGGGGCSTAVTVQCDRGGVWSHPQQAPHTQQLPAGPGDGGGGTGGCYGVASQSLVAAAAAEHECGAMAAAASPACWGTQDDAMPGSSGGAAGCGDTVDSRHCEGAAGADRNAERSSGAAGEAGDGAECCGKSGGWGRGAVGGLVWGRGAGGPRRPPSNSERATPSQRARLQALSRRRDGGAAGEGFGATHVPSIRARNWNIKGDASDVGQ